MSHPDAALTPRGNVIVTTCSKSTMNVVNMPALTIPNGSALTVSFHGCGGGPDPGSCSLVVPSEQGRGNVRKYEKRPAPAQADDNDQAPCKCRKARKTCGADQMEEMERLGEALSAERKKSREGLFALAKQCDLLQDALTTEKAIRIRNEGILLKNIKSMWRTILWMEGSPPEEIDSALSNFCEMAFDPTSSEEEDEEDEENEKDKDDGASSNASELAPAGGGGGTGGTTNGNKETGNHEAPRGMDNVAAGFSETSAGSEAKCLCQLRVDSE